MVFLTCTTAPQRHDLLKKTVVTQSGQAEPNLERLTLLIILESVVNSEWRKREKEAAPKLKKWVDFERNRPPLHF